MFRFKEFTIHQDRCSMKVGTDGVLLGAWARVDGSERRILDIGTATGLIALQLAQRTSAHIVGVDICDLSQAQENAEVSPWGDRISFQQCPVQQFFGEPFDLVVSNPPFFVDSLTCPDGGRTVARHTTELSFADLHDAVVRLLAPEGRFCLILPPAEMDLFLNSCRQLWPSRRTEISSTPARGVRRVLCELVLQPRPAPQIEYLTIGTGVAEEFTPEYRTLTRDFYLKF